MEEPVLEIRLPGHAEVIKAQRDVVLASCSSAPATGPWHLRPELNATPDTVQAWLECINKTYSSPNMNIWRFIKAIRFAKSVDTRPSIFQDMCNELDYRFMPTSAINVQWQDRVIQLRIMGAMYTTPYLSGLYECTSPNQQGYRQVLTNTELGIDRVEQFSIKVAESVERIMFRIATLGITPVVRTLRNFVRRQSTAPCNVLFNVLDRVYTPRVLQAFPRELLYESMLERELTHSDAQLTLMPGPLQVKYFSPTAASLTLAYANPRPPQFTVESYTASNQNRLSGDTVYYIPMNVILGMRSEHQTRSLLASMLDALHRS